jgi:nucleotide-binding universal stress UspA family protein
MNTLFVPTDFSACALNGVRLAELIARKTKGDIVVHHNVATLTNWPILTREERINYPDVMIEVARTERLLGAIARERDNGNPAITTMISYGITADAIISRARDSKASMIVMGSHGSGMTDSPFIGSNVQKVVRLADCPVLLANNQVAEKGIQQVVFPFHLEEDVRGPFKEIRKLTDYFGATIHLLFINTYARFRNSRDINAEMDKFCVDFPDQQFVRATYCSSDAAAGIIEYSEDIGADLIAMATHDRQHKAQYLIGITESISCNTDIPVMSVNMKRHVHTLSPLQSKDVAGG